jgi:hypothetical protein
VADGVDLRVQHVEEAVLHEVADHALRNVRVAEKIEADEPKVLVRDGGNTVSVVSESHYYS